MSTGAVRSLTDADFDAAVGGSATPVLVDFWATWCGPCRILAPILESIAEEQEGRLDVVAVDIEANPELVERFGVTSVPTMKLIDSGRVVRTIMGAKPKRFLTTQISEALAAG